MQTGTIIQSKRGNNSVLIREILKAFEKARPQGVLLAARILDKIGPNIDPVYIAKYVHKLIQENFFYASDQANRQVLQLPSAFIRNRYGDCKAHTILAGSILQGLDIPVYATFSKGFHPNGVKKKHYSHIYLTFFDKNGKKYIIDPVSPLFNNEADHHKKLLIPLQIETIADDMARRGRRRKTGLKNLRNRRGSLLNLRNRRKAAMRLQNPQAVRKLRSVLSTLDPQQRKKVIQRLNRRAKLALKNNIRQDRRAKLARVLSRPQKKLLTIAGGDEMDEGQILSIDLENEDIGRRGRRRRKNRRAARKAKRRAKKAARKSGLSRKQARGAGRAAKAEKKLEFADPDSEKAKRLKDKLKINLARKAGDKAAMKAAKKARRKRRGARAVNVINKINPVLGAGRGAFMALLALNYRGLASKLDQILKDPKKANQLEKKWYRLGGKMGRLKKAINKGKGKRPKQLFGKKKGINAAATGATLAAAGSVLAAILPLVKKLLGKDKNTDGAEADVKRFGSRIKNFAKKIKDKVKADPNFNEIVQQGTGAVSRWADNLENEFETAARDQLDQETGEGSDQEGFDQEGSGQEKNYTSLIIGGAALAGAALLLSKQNK